MDTMVEPHFITLQMADIIGQKCMMEIPIVLSMDFL